MVLNVRCRCTAGIYPNTVTVSSEAVAAVALISGKNLQETVMLSVSTTAMQRLLSLAGMNWLGSEGRFTEPTGYVLV